MKTTAYTQKEKELRQLGESYIGRTAQSTVLTMIGSKGGKVMEPAQKITGYEIVEEFQMPSLMVIMGGESVFEETLRAINSLNH